MIDLRKIGLQRGVGMLEVLIALLVLAVGALGFAGVQMVAMQKSEDANYRSTAMLIAQDAVERIQANPSELADYLSDEPVETPEDAPDQTCSDDCDISALDLTQLAWAASRGLPNGQIKIDNCEFNGLTCVVVNWVGRAAGGNGIDDCMNDDGINLSEDANCLVLEFRR